MKTKREFLQEITKQYRDAGEVWPTTAKHIAAWAIREGHWKPHPKSMIEQCAGELAAAMREEYFTDPQGRKVRAKHAVRELVELADGKHEQLALWVDIKDATHEQMLLAFQFRRKLVFADCRQLKTDVDSYNENYSTGQHVEMCFDFGEDLLESEQPVEYPGLTN